MNASYARRRIRILATGAVLLGVLAVVAWFAIRSSASEDSDPVACATDRQSDSARIFAKTVGDARVLALDSRPVALHDLAGKRLTVLVFCSYHCPCSNGYIGRLRELRGMYESDGVAFSAINANADETVDGLKDYVSRKHYPLPVYRDDGAVVADMLGATVTPEVYLFDASWRLQYHGRIDDDKSGLFVRDRTLKNAIDTLLTGKPLAVRERMIIGCAITRSSGGT